MAVNNTNNQTTAETVHVLSMENIETALTFYSADGIATACEEAGLHLTGADVEQLLAAVDGRELWAAWFAERLVAGWPVQAVVREMTKNDK